MIDKFVFAKIGLVIATLAASVTASGQSAWVSDEFEVTLRTGPSTNNAIVRMLPSGAQLQVLEQNAESGYSRVRSTGGAEGWMLTRYLMDEPSAREQLEKLTEQLTSANAEGASTEAQLSAIREQYQSANRTIQQLQGESARLQSELEQISSKAANTLAIDRQNQELQRKLTEAEIQLNVLEQEKETLSGQGNRNWFITGALVLFGGIVLGLLLPKMKFQRRSRYDRF